MLGAPMFTLLKTDPETKARRGRLVTNHGTIKTLEAEITAAPTRKEAILKKYL